MNLLRLYLWRGRDTGATKPTTFEDLITAAGERYGVPVSLIKAVIDAESSFNPNAVSLQAPRD